MPWSGVLATAFLPQGGQPVADDSGVRAIELFRSGGSCSGGRGPLGNSGWNLEAREVWPSNTPEVFGLVSTQQS